MDFRKKITLSLFQQHKKAQAKLHELSYLFWECTLRCNFNCLHCGSDCMQQAAVPDMPIADFLKTLDIISPHVNPNKTIVVITGGEPLMRRDLEICGMEITKKGYPWGMVTNGYLLDESRFKSLLHAGLRSISISLDGASTDTHDWFRAKKGSFGKSLEAIKRVAQTPNLEYDVVTCVNKRNIGELETMKNMLIEIGVKNWRVFSVFPKGRAANNAELKLSSQEFICLMEFIKKTRSEGKINASYGCEGYVGDYEMEVRDAPFTCNAGIHIASVLADGSISACPSLRGDYIQGNIYKDNIWTVWNEKYQIMRNRAWTKTGKCANCKSYKYCQGNALHLRDEQSGEVLFCHMEMIEHSLR